uniref:gap junction beta-2 protein-like n=1 Tax=Styela clava TaxID=7725 RepID=UPI001939FAD1|nr:gap junction beta-2 protein-like [Styela clava]
MWSGIEKILEHVSSYSSNAGKLWYLLVFVFRLIVVVTVGQSVYSDEQSAFRCSTKVIGCDNVCYDRFSKISHIRFWAFQLLAVTAPSVVFHFYSLNVGARIEKIRMAENAADDDSNVGLEDNSVFGSVKAGLNQRDRKKLLRRRKSVGAFKQKKVFATHANNALVDLTITRNIRIAYLTNVCMRIVLEALSLYCAYSLFHFTDYTVKNDYNPFEIILIRVPQVFRCDGENVEWACGQHMSLGDQSGYVPCWVSRPWEKTIFMCYMNILSAICFLLSVIEFVQLSFKYTKNFRKKRQRKPLISFNHQESRMDVPTFRSVDETDGVRMESNLTSTEKDKIPNGNVQTQFQTHLVPIRKVMNEMKPRKKSPQGKISKGIKVKKKKRIGIRVHDQDDEISGGSDGYHSSEYEETGSDDEEESLASVSQPESV